MGKVKIFIVICSIIGVILLSWMSIRFLIRQNELNELNKKIIDTEIWNGFVVEKKRDDFFDEYKCNPKRRLRTRTVKRGKRTETETYYDTIYDTCTRNVYTTWIKLFDGTKILYDVRKPVEDKESQQWLNVQVGEPASVQKQYKNYIKGSDTTILKRKAFLQQYKYKDLVPEPPTVFDKFKINQFIQIKINEDYKTFTNEEINIFNQRLMLLNANLGSKKQLNTIIFIIPDYLNDFIYAIDEKWIGSNKNEVVLFLSIDKDMNMVRVQSLSWSDTNIDIENALSDLLYNKNIGDKERMLLFLNDIETILENKFDRKAMKEYEYLYNEIKRNYD